MASIQRAKQQHPDPEISIIVPTYQHGRDIALCLESIFRQTFSAYEIIVVDDGSTDNTQEALRPYLDRVTLIVKENGGGSQSANQARNLGCKEACGTYLLFCDADVVMKPGCLAKMRQALLGHPEASYAYSSFKFGWKTFGGWQFDADTLRKLNYIHTTSLIRREHFPGFDETIAKFQDWDLWLTMLGRGHVGVWIPETLFRCIPHGAAGISTWIPRFFYSIPWEKLGWRVMSVEKYRQKEQVIRDKHRLPAPEPRGGGLRQLGLLVALFVGFELLSFAGFRFPLFGNFAFVFAFLAMAALAWKRLPLALLVWAGELFVGSQGGAMLALAAPGLPAPISLRVGLFAAIWAGFAAKCVWGLARGGEVRAKAFAWLAVLKAQKMAWPFAALLAAFAFAVARAFFLGNSPTEIILDANAYAFFLMLPPLAAGVLDPDFRRLLPSVFAAAMTVVTAKTLFVLYLFSHRLGSWMRPMYVWIRDTRVGEITRIGETDFYRVFFQSHLFSTVASLGVALWLAYGLTRRDGGTRRNAAFLAVLLIPVVLSLSRSFWIGGLAAALAMAVVMLATRAEVIVWRRLVGAGAAALLVAFFAIAGTYAFPIPYGTGAFSLADLLGDRATSVSDAAANSRWSLLPKMIEAGQEHPVLGSGFGRTVTYKTSDPRLLEIFPNGEYTTAAFEWGYLDLWIKLGVFGLAAYAWFVWAALWGHMKTVWALRRKLSFFAPADEEKKSAVFSFGICLGIIALLAVHVFSPYLNHPLGIGMLLLAAVWLAGNKMSSQTLPALTAEQAKENAPAAVTQGARGV